MHSLAEQREAIGLMAAHESAIAELYRAYAADFPQCESLFLRLAEDEVEHARLISALAAKVSAGQVQVNPGRFHSPALLSSLDFVRERLKEAQDKKVSLASALAAARDLELGLIEKRFFEIIEGDAPEIRELLQTLADETSAHRHRILEAACQAQEESNG